MWFFNAKSLLKKLNAQNISDEKKSKLLKNGKVKIELEIKKLDANGLLKYLYNSNLPNNVRKLIYNEIVKMSSNPYYSYEKKKYELIKKIFSEEYATESLLESEFCSDDFKAIIIDKVFGKDLIAAVSNENISTYKKKLIIDFKVSEYNIEKFLCCGLSNELIDYIFTKKLIDAFSISRCLNEEKISSDIKKRIISNCINAQNIFEVQAGVWRFVDIDLLELRKELVEEHFEKANASNILEYFSDYFVPDEFKNRLYVYKFDEIKKAVMNCNQKALKEVFMYSRSNILNEFIFETRKDACYKIINELCQYELLTVLAKATVPDEFKMLVIKKHKGDLIKEIKKLTYRDLKLWYLTDRSSIPQEIQDLMIELHYGEIVENIMEFPESELDSEIQYANMSKELLKLMLKFRYDEKMTFDLLSKIRIYSRVVDLVLEAKSDLLTEYLKRLSYDDMFSLRELKVISEIRDKILLQNKDYIISVIEQLDSTKKIELLDNKKVSGVAKQFLLSSFGIEGLDLDDCLTLLINGNAELLINHFNNIKNYVVDSNINFNSLLQYGSGSKKHSSWLENLVTIITEGNGCDFIKCKDYFFKNYYVELVKKENSVYIIESFLDMIDNYTRYKDLISSIVNNNVNLDEKNKMDLKFLFSVNVTDGMEVPKTMEELSGFKIKLYSNYIEKINNSLLDEQEIKNIFNSLLFIDSKVILDSIGGTGALRTLRKDNINNQEICYLIDEIIMYGRVVEMVNDSNNIVGLNKVLRYVFSDFETLTKFQNLFFNFEERISTLYEMDSHYNLTSLDVARRIGAIDCELSARYGGEVFDFSDKNYTLYAHILSENENVEDILEGVSSGDKNFISVSPISYRGQTYYWCRDEAIFAYDKIPIGSFIRSSITNMGSNRYVSKNSSEVDIKDVVQRGILESSSVTINNAETLLYREDLKPCGLVLPGGRVPTKAEITIHEKYNLPFIVTQKVRESIRDVKYVFNRSVVAKDSNIVSCRELEEIIKLLMPNIPILKENAEYTGREIAIFTDCHSMYEPTIAVLEDIRRHGISEIYSLGDNVGLGPNPCEVFDLLEEYGVLSVAGNSEYYNILGIEPFDYFYDLKKQSQEWTESKLGSKRIKNMKFYPASIDLVFGGKKLALCHFINDVRWDYHDHSTHTYQAMFNTGHGAEQFLYTNSDACKEKINNCITKYKKDDRRVSGYILAKKAPIFDGKLVTDYDTIIQGHVHFDREDKIKNTTIHTLRAVGMGYEKDADDTACYYVLKERKGGSYEKEKRLIKFNKNSLISSIYNSDLPNKDVILRYVKK